MLTRTHAARRRTFSIIAHRVKVSLPFNERASTRSGTPMPRDVYPQSFFQICLHSSSVTFIGLVTISVFASHACHFHEMANETVLVLKVLALDDSPTDRLG